MPNNDLLILFTGLVCFNSTSTASSVYNDSPEPLCLIVSLSPLRNPSALFPGASPAQHPLVTDQRDVAWRGALTSLPVTTAGLSGLPPLHEPWGRRARLQNPAHARYVWNLHDQHARSASQTGVRSIHHSISQYIFSILLWFPSLIQGFFSPDTPHLIFLIYLMRSPDKVTCHHIILAVHTKTGYIALETCVTAAQWINKKCVSLIYVVMV